MLIASPRHSANDVAAWEVHRRTDEINAYRWRGWFAREEAKSIAMIRAFVEAGPCYVGCSWGKDSTVVAHLVTLARVRPPIVWVRLDGVDNPDCPLVRDAFLAAHDVEYHELRAPVGESRRLERGIEMARDRFGRRYVNGIRATESRVRRLSILRHGEDTGAACRPIAWWSSDRIYAYLHARELPVHPAYGCSMGGRLAREWLRVSSIGGERGTGHGRAEWERRYYPLTGTGNP